MVLLILLASVAGVLVGMTEAHLGHVIWPMAIGLCVIFSLAMGLSRRWVCEPVEALIRQLRRAGRSDRMDQLQCLPVDRHDEIGQIARSLHDVAACSIRNSSENKHLRRTLDDRVATAVNLACGRLEQLAMRDPLTKLGNRRFLMESLDPLIQSVQQAEADLICIVIDVDNFKQVNDQLGHTGGDQLLVFLADLIRGSVRGDDCAVRLGGDEFAVFLPACSLQSGAQLARQISALFAQNSRATIPREIGCNLSIGMASLQRDLPIPSTCESQGQVLIDVADARLYKAKREGKGRIESG